MDGKAIVIVDQHEPHGDVAARLLELAQEQGHDARTVEAQRGEHDAALSFRVPPGVAEAFDAERRGRWPLPDGKQNNDNDPSTPPAPRQTRPGKATKQE